MAQRDRHLLQHLSSTTSGITRQRVCTHFFLCELFFYWFVGDIPCEVVVEIGLYMSMCVCWKIYTKLIYWKVQPQNGIWNHVFSNNSTWSSNMWLYQGLKSPFAGTVCLDLLCAVTWLSLVFSMSPPTTAEHLCPIARLWLVRIRFSRAESYMGHRVRFGSNLGENETGRANFA